MDGNNITSNLIHNASYSSFTTVSSIEKDPRILATSLLMYKIGMCGNKVYDIIMYQINGLELGYDHSDTTGKWELVGVNPWPHRVSASVSVLRLPSVLVNAHDIRHFHIHTKLAILHILINFVFPHICSFLRYLDLKMLSICKISCELAKGIIFQGCRLYQSFKL